MKIIICAIILALIKYYFDVKLPVVIENTFLKIERIWFILIKWSAKAYLDIIMLVKK